MGYVKWQKTHDQYQPYDLIHLQQWNVMKNNWIPIFVSIWRIVRAHRMRYLIVLRKFDRRNSNYNEEEEKNHHEHFWLGLSTQKQYTQSTGILYCRLIACKCQLCGLYTLVWYGLVCVWCEWVAKVWGHIALSILFFFFGFVSHCFVLYIEMKIWK